MIEFIEKVTKAIENKEYAVGIFLNLKKKRIRHCRSQVINKKTTKIWY